MAGSLAFIQDTAGSHLKIHRKSLEDLKSGVQARLAPSDLTLTAVWGMRCGAEGKNGGGGPTIVIPASTGGGLGRERDQWAERSRRVERYGKGRAGQTCFWKAGGTLRPMERSLLRTTRRTVVPGDAEAQEAGKSRWGQWWCGENLDTLGLRHLLGLPVRCQVDRSVSSELRGEVWADI